eukprot:TRINITY_DN12662_c0_g1_i1.p1 TRINITY_DN12662_c0_g1~~TRINITY_DN12662_c0_g1_i1.p1  ORF type:complete len:287 (-),score=47.46 TRINITY_DN12662_c0_g1_i1:101-961(-)
MSKDGHGELSIGKHIVAGASAGLCEVLVMYPLDVVKTRLQLQKTGEGKYTSVPQTFRTIIQEEGVGRLYRGIASPILAEAPKRAVKFAGNELYKPLFKSANGQLSYLGAGGAGVCAGVTEAFINCPFEVVKVRLQSKDNVGQYKGTVDATLKIAQQEGVLALYRGLEAQITRNAVWNGTYFAIIPIVKDQLWTPDTKGSEMLKNFTAGLVGGTIATTLNTPFDVAKSRMQNMKGRPNPWSFVMLADIYRTEGFKACYKGLVPRLYRLGPGGGIMLLAFDLISGWLK